MSLKNQEAYYIMECRREKNMINLRKPFERNETMKLTYGLLLGVCLLGLTSCQPKEVEQSFSLTAEEQDAFTAQIDAVLDEFYWEYDKDSLTFAGGVVPQDTSENERLFSASAILPEYDLRTKAGSPAVMAMAELLHHNGDIAGDVTFVFVQDTLSGVYYNGGYDRAPYSLTERNPFLENGKFIAYENWQGVTETGFIDGRGSLPAGGFTAQGKDQNGSPITASIVDGNIEIYHLSGQTLSRYRTLSPPGDLEAISATFVKESGMDYLAVLLAEVIESDGLGEGEKVFTRAEKVIIYDETFTSNSEIVLADTGVTAVGAQGDKLFLFADQSMDIYKNSPEGWQRLARNTLRHNVTQCHVSEMDGDDQPEIFMTDGMDLYLYRYFETGLFKIWSSHLGVESLYGSLYSGDLNRDGVKEIYVCDATGTTVRYLLTEKGLRSSNEDINYSQAIYPFDWNGDGLSDYWMETNDEGKRAGNLFLSQKNQ